MKSKGSGASYNERLFSGGVRKTLHMARFEWLASEIVARGCSADRVLEIGCFDGKVLNFLPRKPSRYVGYDANWEGGLDIARKKWGDDERFSFAEATSPQDIELPSGELFDVAVSMETLEHVPPEMVDGYLRTIANHLNGYLFVTVPNEKGLLFLLKWLAKRTFSKDAEAYTAGELWNTVWGRTDRVARREHKGFNYLALISEIEKHFDVVDVSGHPFGFLHHSLCFGVGIVAKSR